MLFHEITETSGIGGCRLNLNRHFGLCGWLLGTVCGIRDPILGRKIPQIMQNFAGIMSYLCGSSVIADLLRSVSG
jgi:hypothetical protein